MAWKGKLTRVSGPSFSPFPHCSESGVLIVEIWSDSLLNSPTFKPFTVVSCLVSPYLSHHACFSLLLSLCFPTHWLSLSSSNTCHTLYCLRALVKALIEMLVTLPIPLSFSDLHDSTFLYLTVCQIFKMSFLSTLLFVPLQLCYLFAIIHFYCDYLINFPSGLYAPWK